MMFDVKDFYPLITEKLLTKAINLAAGILCINEKEKQTECRISERETSSGSTPFQKQHLHQHRKSFPEPHQEALSGTTQVLQNLQ